MPVEKSAGAVVFRKEDSKIYYLLLHYESGHWGFPKGLIEQNEELKETAHREIKEETAIQDLEFVEGFKEWIKYFYKFKGKKIFKIVTYFLAEAKQKEVEISYEHIGYKWLPYEQALNQLTYNNTKQILKKAHRFLKS